MTSDNDIPWGGELAQLVRELATAAQSVAADDLRLLAKIHGWCERIAQVVEDTGDRNRPELLEQVTAIGEKVEGLVLGAVDDPQAAVAWLRQTAADLCRDAVPAGDAAEQMAKVFADPPDEALPDAAAGQEAAEEPPSAPDKGVPAYVPEPLILKPSEADFVKGFVEEANEHIAAVESAVLEVERAPEDKDKINDLFRPFHTIKGMAGFLNLRDINCLTHEVETVLDQGRKGERQVTPGLIDLVFDVVDILKGQVGAIAAHLADPQGEVVPQPPVAEMIAYLRKVVAGRAEPEGRQPTAGSGAQRVGENLVEQGAVAREAVDFALEKQQRTPAKKTGQILVEDGAVTPRQVSQAIRPQAQAAAAKSGAPVGDQSIRIDTAKLDALVDMVGELVIAQTLVSTNGRIAHDPALSRPVGQVAKIVRDVQEAAMAMRMVPIGPTFQRMARLVRDVSRKAGKTVELHVSGEETELDKNVIQQIGDPLVHMIRNAVDHGIEPPEGRRQAGKDGTGHVYLNAFHHAGNIVIEIRDDGRGLDRDVLIAKAIEKGLLSTGDELNDQQAFQLIFAPGFSTAKEVTDISGRGVGMDVVKRNIEALRGRVEIASEKGQGSAFSIRLPLTLAIIDGMVVRAATERFIIPTISIEQTLRPQPQQIATVQRRGQVLQVRGELVPVMQLGQLFGLSGPVDPCQAMVVIAQCDDRRIGIVVEELIGQQQVVIKSLGERFLGLRGVSGAAILGDGRVGLILEMLGLEALYNTHATTTARADAAADSGPAEIDRPDGSSLLAADPLGDDALLERELALN